MKKILLLVLALTITTNLVKAQDEQPHFPYAKILKMTNQELLDAKFKYNRYTNQYVLTKKNRLSTIACALSISSSTPINYIPDIDDYEVIIQKGEDKISTAQIYVIFYDSEIYHKILTFAADYGENLLETDTKLLNKTQFNYNGYSFEAEYTTKSQSTSTANYETRYTTKYQSAAIAGYGGAVVRDDSYNRYVFRIFTDVEEHSDYLISQDKKKAKRDSKGKKKRSAEDFM